MTYRLKNSRWGLSFLLLITTLKIITSYSLSHDKFLFYFSILTALLIITLFYISYTFTIQESLLTYKILLFNILIYQRVVLPEHIKEIKFKRFGWNTKGAVIQTTKGFNMRILLYSPDGMMEDLNKYADENNLFISKTKDYQLLERRSRYVS
ncbi:hypothetical protein MHH81_00755 [Psychrobacillus sp. FSL H8-0484]|uniref:hypothetical protein n=1 Tax=Psychrobacillus sp. FSL H8-0484 TaxID=2921390 RepID=UPI0030FBB0DB